MRYIEHVLGLVSRSWHHVEAPRPIRLADALCDRLRRDLRGSLIVQFLRRRDRQRQIA